MKLKSLYALLFCIFMTGCLDGQKQSDHSILIAYMSTEYPELGSSVCYLNEGGVTLGSVVMRSGSLTMMHCFWAF